MEVNSYLYTLYLAVDTNFRLKGKDCKLQELELAGYGAFVKESAYQSYIHAYVDQLEITLCSKPPDFNLTIDCR
jgi:hypothetical protein